MLCATGSLTTGKERDRNRAFPDLKREACERAAAAYGEGMDYIGIFVRQWLVAVLLIWLMTRDSKRRRAERLPEQSEDGSTVSETAAADDERWTVQAVAS